MKNLYLVKNLSSGEITSPGVFRKDGSLSGDVYSLLKIDRDVIPTGDYVLSITREEYKAVNSLPLFSPVYERIREYVYVDRDFCSNVELQFDSDSGVLSQTDTNTLLTLLGGVAAYLDRNSPKYAYTELLSITPTTLFPQVVKDKYIAIFEEYLKKYPR